MKTDEFETRLQELSAMVGSDQSIELFSQEYESLLNEIKVQSDPRYTFVLRMRKLLDRQTQYLLNAWLRANRNKDMI